MVKYKIHFEDVSGQGTITCATQEDFNIAYATLISDPPVDNIWCEYLDEDEGWMPL